MRVLEPKPYKLDITKKIIAVVDTETDPFAQGLVVKPFTLGFFDGHSYIDFWGDDCVKQFFVWLECETKSGNEYIIYAHNGGKFDFFFFLDYLDADQTPLIMGSRIVKAEFQGQEFRDSYAIIPQSLSAYKKDEISYDKFTRKNRERHKQEILKYQKSDCVYTHELIAGFHDMFGDKLTIASASLPMLNSFTGYDKIISDKLDDKLRNFYFGGRNQCFEIGLLKDNWKVYDRNSMYPAVMRDCLHPVSSDFELSAKINKNTDFALIDAVNDNCLPSRLKNGSLDFTKKSGQFYATIHEINAGLETGTLKINKVLHTYDFKIKQSFDEFVNKFYQLRLDAKALDDKVRDILYKFCLNSGYGKFAINPRKFKQWTFTIDSIPEPQATINEPDGWSLETQSNTLMIWSRPNPKKSGFQNVATAASITGAARANLHRNLALATRPIYCDTDSIICTDFSGQLNETELGGWKLEATGNLAAIGGKKLYAVFNDDEPIKKACKGVNLTHQEIIDVCNGTQITYHNPVPNFKLNGDALFTSRRINMTGKI